MEEEQSAKRIQRWWRKKLDNDQRIADKARKLAQDKYVSKITLNNDRLISALDKLRREKNQDAMRYERILNMPARDVNNFMRREMGAKVQERIENYTENQMKKRHKAARIIQKTFRAFYRQRTAEKYLRSLSIIKPSKRVEYLAQINDRISTKKYVRVVPLEEIRSELLQHKQRREKDAADFAKRQMLIQEMKRASVAITMASFQLLNLTNLTTSNPLINYKASQEHKKEMEKIEEDEWA